MWVEVEYGTFYNGRRASGTLRLNLHQLCVDEGAMVKCTRDRDEKIVRRKKQRKARVMANYSEVQNQKGLDKVGGG